MDDRRRYRNPSPPGKDFDYKSSTELGFFTPHVFSFEPFQSCLHLIHKSMWKTPPTTDGEEESQPAPVEIQADARIKSIKKEPEPKKPKSIISPDKEEERPKICSSKSTSVKATRRLIDYSDSDKDLSEDVIRDSGSSSPANRIISSRRKRRKSLSGDERKRKERNDSARDRQSVREEHKKRHDQKRVSVNKELHSDGEYSSGDRSSHHKSPDKPGRYKSLNSSKRRSRNPSPELRSRYRSPERPRSYRNVERASRYKSPERPSRCKSPVESSHRSPTDSSQYSPSRSPKQEPIDSKEIGEVGIYYCKYCQLSVNSELTFNSHIRGKKHAKAIKALTVHEVARGSIALIAPPPINPELPRFAVPAPGRNRIPLRDISRIQKLCDDFKLGPLPGLDRVLEIRTEVETSYYCELCDAPCGTSSIMPHLTGYKHQLRFLKEIEPRFYYQNKDAPKNRIEKQVLGFLYEHERRVERKLIQVVEDILDPRAPPIDPYYQLPGPSWGPPLAVKVKPENAESESAVPSNDDYLDTSKSDFYCTACDSHMNNVNMWEAHIRGKRHLKNTKKIPGENKSKVKAQKVPDNIASNLEKKLVLLDPDDVVVGLNFIKETQGSNGNLYNCYLCSSCSTDADILDHIFNVKHKIKYLKKLSADGCDNAIESISDIELRPEFRDSLIEGECRKMLLLYGSGKPEVYKKLEDLPSNTW